MIPPELMATFAEVGKDLYSLGLVSSHGGNLSVRNGHEMWITGTGTMLGRLRERHMSLVLPDGTHSGPPPSSDTLLHSTVYALGGALAVVHAHPHHAIAMTFETEKFVPPDFEGQHFLEDVPVVPQGPNQVERVAAALQSRLVVVLQGHGAYARGQTLWEALHWVTALEESAHIAWLRR
ncbi:MAG: class II aldolase/adducin family protein [Dehalococcoidia bacterium]